MPSPEELIIEGRLPDGTPAAELPNNRPAEVKVGEVQEAVIETDLSKDEFGHPIFADLNEQVEYDWNNVPSERVKSRKNSNAAYAAALNDYLNGTAPVKVEDAPVPVKETPVVSPAAAVALAETDEDDENLVKTAKGWEYRIPGENGAGDEVFKGKTVKEVLKKVASGKQNATKKIREQEAEKRLLIADSAPDVDDNGPRLRPRVPTAEEQWEIAQNISDPSKAVKALDKYIEIRLGGSIDQVVEKITTAESDLEYRRARNEAKAFIAETPEFYNTPENITTLADYVESNGWAATKRNLRKAFVILTNEEKLELEPIEPEEEVLTPTETAVSTAAPVETVVPSAPPAAVPAAQPTSEVSTQPAGLPAGTRIRPGSSSTGLSPRQSSVRTGGAAPAAPVGLTVEEYQRIPTSTVKQRYRSDPIFKAGVDKLMAEGKI